MLTSPLQLAESYIQAGELADALEVLDAHLRAAPDSEAFRLRAAVLLRLGDRASLLRALTDLDSLTDPTADDHVRRSIIYQHLGDWPSACNWMAQARALRPDDRITERYLYALEHADRLAEARALVATLPRTWRWLQTAGDLALADGERTAALAHFKAALDHLEQTHDTLSDPFAASLRDALLTRIDRAARAG